ncbi:MAG: tRNA lysidine(34) synthetase TilS [Anaerolineae bacterium]|nr:tRNA lysidine(34) synthetase TilS [Anaerolineae bacterium]
MIDLIRRTIQKYHLIPPDSALVLGVSGGADSLALLHILYTLQPTFRYRLHVATLDHGLRGETGAADAEFVRHFAESLGVPVTLGRANVSQLATAQHTGIEAAARNARYDFLATVARKVGAERVAVAHHAGDQAETVLMHLLRGTGLAGLGGMALQSPMPEHPEVTLTRPLLWNTRAEIEAYCKAHGLEAREDATNRDTSLLRNNIRLNILPDLERVNPHLQRVLGQLADIARVEDDFVEEQLGSFCASTAVKTSAGRVFIDRTAFRGLHPALQRRLIAWAARQVASVEELDYLHIVEAVDMSVNGQQGGRALLTDGLQLRIEYDSLIVERQNAPMLDLDQPLLPENTSFTVAIPGVVKLPDGKWSVRVTLEMPHKNELPEARLSIPEGAIVTLRTRREGDRFEPLGLDGHTQKLNSWMINRKVPRYVRDRVPLVCINEQIAAIFVDSQWYVSESSSVKDNSPRVVYFHFLQNL